MIGPFTRILLRYTAAALVTWGIFSPDAGAQLATDPDVAAVLGLAIGFAVEGYYWAARRYGWAT